ncbi:MAG: adenylate/guanylate cyclase domain-containing protein [Oceanococcus sp.]
MKKESDVALALASSGRRFLDQKTEAAFGAWELRQIFGRIPLMVYVSGTAWLFGPIVGWFYAPSLFGPEILLPCYLLALPMHAFGLRRPLAIMAANVRRTHVLALLTSNMVFVSCLMSLYACWYHWNEPVAAMVAGAILANWALYLRLPMVYALGFGVCLIVPGVVGVMLGDLSAPLTWTVSWMGVFQIFLIGATAASNERIARSEYANLIKLEQQRQQLETGQRLIRRYVPPTVADQIISGSSENIEAPARLRVTVMFADIAGFTSAADKLEPEVVAQILNEFLTSMSQHIHNEGGTLNEVAGDGLMAIFGAPIKMEPEEQARKAFDAGCRMMEALAVLNVQWRKLGLDEPLKMRIGINTGIASVGSYGSEGRMTYTAIGTQTNIAARIESAAEPGEILVSYATNELLGEVRQLEPRGELNVKGVHFPIKVFALRVGGAQQIVARDV